MIPRKDNYAQIESTLQGEDVAMGIDLASMPHLMNVLTDLYEDRELACIREYATNAWDANREAGNSAPIEVETPSALRPLLVVRDRGVGLSAEDIRVTYSQYGASTKRGTNDAVGMLGLGCKSALTYTDQFTVVSVKDGTRTTVSISRDESGRGNMKIIAQEPTTDPNGTEVQVPALRDNTFAEKAQGFFRFWEPGHVLLNGQPPPPLGGVELTDRLTVIEVERGDHNDWIVMGNVPYPAQLRIYDRVSYYGSKNRAVVARVDIGAVDFTPSREALMDSDRTTATLDRIRADFAKAAKGGVQREVDKAASKAEALTAFVRARDALPRHFQPDPSGISYRGEALPAFHPMRHWERIANAGYKNRARKEAPSPDLVANGIWVVDYDNAEFTGTQRNKLLAWLEHNGESQPSQRPLLTIAASTPPNADWVPDDNVVSWPDVRKWQPPPDPNAPASAGKKRVTGSYNVWKGDEQTQVYPMVREVPATDIPQDDSVFWVASRKYEGKKRHERLTGLHPGAWLVLLPRTRVAKFKRDFPKARPFLDFVQAELKRQVKALTPDEVLYAHFADRRNAWADYEVLVGHDAELVDSDLRRCVRLAEGARGGKNGLRVAARNYGVAFPEPKKTTYLSVCRLRYPLLGAVNYTAEPEDLILYANAAYAARKE